MAWTTQKWINCRATAAYVSDGSGEIPLSDAPSSNNLPIYPKSLTVNGDTFNAGWVVGTVDGARDRSAGYPTRLAGGHLITNASGAPTEFTCELLGGTGQYEIRLASGDPAGFGTTNPYIQIYDDLTLVATIDGTAGIANFMDAGGTSRTDAAWPGSNPALTLTFNSTTGTGSTPILRIKCGDTATAGRTAINTVGIKYLGAAGPNIVSVDDMTPEEGTTLVVTGTALKASGNSTATIGGVSQTITTQSATVPELTVTLGTLKFGTTYNLVITDSDAAPSNSFALTSLQPAAGNGFVDVGTPNADTSIRLTSIADAVSGDQVEWENSALITINSDLTWDADESVTTIRARIWTTGDGYGPWTNQTINAVGGYGVSSRRRLRMGLCFSL